MSSFGRDITKYVKDYLVVRSLLHEARNLDYFLYSKNIFHDDTIDEKIA
jgi:hypothetical protein